MGSWLSAMGERRHDTHEVEYSHTKGWTPEDIPVLNAIVGWQQGNSADGLRLYYWTDKAQYVEREPGMPPFNLSKQKPFDQDG